MTYLSDIIRFVENAAGHRLNRDEGIQHGKNDRLIRGATLAWMASPGCHPRGGRGRTRPAHRPREPVFPVRCHRRRQPAAGLA